MFSRRRGVTPEALDLNEVVAETEKFLRRTLGAHIELEVESAAELPLIKADRGQLDQVLVNLAVNARDAMPDGGTLVIRTEAVSHGQGKALQGARSTPGGEYVALAVSDIGAGMPAEVRARAFEPFFTTKEPGQGTGLGLATVCGIVEQAGGTIRLDSEVGVGTTIVVYLPVTAEPPGGAAAENERAPSGNNELVLVVEDEAPVGALTCRILQAHDYRVLSATRGEEALELCRRHGEAIDLLLTDSIMPAMAGEELVGKALELVPSLRVLYMSGYIDAEHVRRGIHPPGPELLQKPFGRDALLRHVARALAPTSQGDLPHPS